jgi:regulator of nonsense transcripts 2
MSAKPKISADCRLILQDAENSGGESVSEDEAIVVTRHEEEVDPEDEAEFQREYAKMMAESLESRKFERKPLFDVPLPVRQKNKDAVASGESIEGSTSSPVGTMAFSLLTKKGNRQQVCEFDCPTKNQADQQPRLEP